MNRAKAERVIAKLALQLRGARWVAVGSFRRGVQVKLHDLDVLVEDADRAGQRQQVWVLGEPVDVVYTAPESWGPALRYLTGPPEENGRLHAIAKGQGLLLNEHGLWRVTPRRRRRVDDNTEQGVYEALGLPYVEPEAR